MDNILIPKQDCSADKFDKLIGFLYEEGWKFTILDDKYESLTEAQFNLMLTEKLRESLSVEKRSELEELLNQENDKT